MIGARPMETVLILLIVGGAVAYAARRAWHAIRPTRRPPSTGCGSDCGCH